MALILDSGPLYALLDARDGAHQACRRLVETSDEDLVVPAPVLTEVDYFIQTRLQPRVRLTLLGDIVSGAITVINLGQDDYSRVLELCSRYADSDIGLVDAAVLAIVERLNEPKLATLDLRHAPPPPH